GGVAGRSLPARKVQRHLSRQPASSDRGEDQGSGSSDAAGARALQSGRHHGGVKEEFGDLQEAARVGGSLGSRGSQAEVGGEETEGRAGIASRQSSLL